MSTVEKSTLFPAELVTEMFSKVKGHSSIAKMCGQEPIPFCGKDVFTFDFANDISVVGESGAKPAGDAVVASVQIRPIKVVYQSRVSDEFVKASEEKRLQYLKEFAEGFQKKVGAGLDKMALHGVNPKTGSSSDIIGNNHLDYVIENYSSGANVVEYTSGTDAADAKLEAAIAKIEEPNGAILSRVFRTDIANMSNSANGRKYPEFAWGACPNELGGMALDANNTVGTDDNYAYVGNWTAFRWGFAEEIPLEVIEFGNPDGGSSDLKETNQVLLRSEAYIGWGILDAAAFAKVVAPSD